MFHPMFYELRRIHSRQLRALVGDEAEIEQLRTEATKLEIEEILDREIAALAS